MRCLLHVKAQGPSYLQGRHARLQQISLLQVIIIVRVSPSKGSLNLKGIHKCTVRKFLTQLPWVNEIVLKMLLDTEVGSY